MDVLNKQCDWLITDEWKLENEPAEWHKIYNVKAYLKTTKAWLPEYYHFDKAGAAKATYKDNTFNIETSRLGKISILISPDMVDLNREVKVVINDKVAFAKKVVADQAFLFKQLKDNPDRKAIWVNKLVLDVSN
ncbi:hypothetical protein [Mucilaginibacter sp. KACC 22063]|uniref:hypothetical protein n=1 Tax=Mucilaginibacter sp. KACC 22063 TaxID=3025666 RepID=UPI002365BCF3|nr:hypothetical protein [Mucilaginibacter sp. KACC 22063]WDF53358.1 hypothetical protein PQ461_10410 [Mucilaginibacter sp. KACC 22063]